jgi:hypothetical protein
MTTTKPSLWASNLAIELIAVVHERPHVEAVKLIAFMLDTIDLAGQRNGIGEAVTIIKGGVQPCPTENSKP